MKVNEIFYSIQGESSRAGMPCAFVRLTGCNLRCSYCDTGYAYEEGSEADIHEVLEKVAAFPTRLVEITGGEPLLQPDVHQLVSRLADGGYTVLIETNGSISLIGLDPRTVVIMDIKSPGSGASANMRWENIPLLKPQDEVKFVLTDRADFDFALDVIAEYGLDRKHAVHLSPAHGMLEPKELAEWMLSIVQGPKSKVQGQKDRVGKGVRLQLQLHKYIWPHVRRGV